MDENFIINENFIGSLKALGFLLTGGLLGHRFTLYRDKRKEYNLALEPIRLCLEKDFLVTDEMIKILKSKISYQCKKIVKIYYEDYAPTMALHTPSPKYDPYTCSMIDQNPSSQDNENKKKKTNAKKRFVKACKLK